MKKVKFGLLALSTLAIGALAGCNKEPSGPTGPTKWTDAESALITDTLYGEIIPFAKGFGNLKVELVDDPDEFINPTITVGSVKSKSDSSKLKSYAKLFKETEGWKANTRLMAKYKNLFEYEKSVEVSEGVTRYVRVQFYATNSYGEYKKSGKGYLYIVAHDQYDYTWPEDFIAENLSYYSSEVVIPTITADRYSYVPGDYSFCAYYASEAEDGGLSDLLTGTEAGWTIYDVKDADGYFLALSPDQKFVLSYLYYADQGLLDVWFMDPVFKSWPQSSLEDIFANYEEYGAEPYAITPFVGGGLYSPNEDMFNAMYIYIGELELINGYVVITQIDNAEEALTQYFSDLGTDGWHYEPTEAPYDDEDHPNADWYEITRVVDEYKYSLELEYDAADGYACITFYLIPTEAPSVDWPAGKINAAKPSSVTDTVPAFVGENEGFVFKQGVITVYEGEDAEVADLIGEYEAFLTNETNGYTQVEGSRYVSPNGQISLQISECYDGFQISVSYLFANNTINGVVSEWLTSNGFASDALPTINFEGAQFEVTRFDSDKLDIVVTGEGLDYAALRDDYVYLLTQSENFEITHSWGDYDKEYTHKTENVSVNPYVSASDVFFLSIYPAD